MENDRDAFLSKARESLASAESDFEGARYNSCANRCYYACFQAAVAALLEDGIRPAGRWGHDFVQVQFVGQLIHRRKRYDSGLRDILVNNLKLRQFGDDHPRLITQTEARRALARIREFVEAVEARLSPREC